MATVYKHCANNAPDGMVITDPSQVLEYGIPVFFSSGCTLNVWNNDKINKDEEKLTSAQITALNEFYTEECQKAILAMNLNFSPVADLEVEKMLILGKWLEVKNEYEQKFFLQARKFDSIWFNDYDIYHEGESDGTTSTEADGTVEQSGTSTGTENATNITGSTDSSLSGDYPNNTTSDTGFATTEGKSNNKSTTKVNDSTTGTTTADETSHNEANGTAHTEDSWHEWRIGAMGRSPNFVWKEAYNNAHNLIGDFANEFAKYFRFEWEKYNEKCACTW